MANQTVRRVKPLRHAVEVFIGVERSLDFLCWQLVSYTASNTRARFGRQLGMIEKGYPSTFSVHDRMVMASKVSAGAFDENSFAAWIHNVFLQNTYISTGNTGSSFQVRIGWVGKLIERARRITLGSSRITWFTDALGKELSKYVPDGYEVRVQLQRYIRDEDENAADEDVKVYTSLIFRVRRAA